MPVFALLYWGFGPLFSAEGFNVGVLRSIEVTLLASGLTVVTEILLFTPLAYHLARSKNEAAETLADIPASIPHPIIGIALVVLDSPLTPTGRFLNSIGINFFDTLLGMVVALTIISAPIYIKAMQPFFESMNRAPEDFALGLGASRLKTFVSVALPNSGNGIMGASLIALSRAMSEFGSIVIISYALLSFPLGLGGVSPASVLIFNLYSSNGLNAAVTASATLVVVSIPIMVALRVVKHRATT
ncbi:MAG: ABC transporter permease [Nitrososphaerota archaeon]|nr:ABC transporter permease [Nitrososphaerota archaeon]